MSQRSPFTRERIDAVTRMYHRTKDAAEILGIWPQSLIRLCHRYQVPTPMQRRRAQRQRVAS